MSRENVEVVKAFIEAWNAGDRSFAIAELCDPAIVLESPFSSLLGEPYRGYAGIEQWVRDVDEQFSDWRIDHDDVREIGDQVIVIGTVQARGRASGVDVVFPVAADADFGDDGRITRVRIFRDVQEALDAAGLSG
jgi:ketosteroid isomerase-like protein